MDPSRKNSLIRAIVFFGAIPILCWLLLPYLKPEQRGGALVVVGIIVAVVLLATLVAVVLRKKQ